MLGVHQDKQVQKAIAQLKLAFDNLEKQQPALSRDVIMQMFELVVSSQNPDVTSLMPPAVAALVDSQDEGSTAGVASGVAVAIGSVPLVTQPTARTQPTRSSLPAGFPPASA